MSTTPPLHLGIALDGAGWHPAAWREPNARPTELFTAGYWRDLAQRSEEGLVDFVTIEDSLALQSSTPFATDEATDEVRGRLDAALIAATLAPVTTHLGLIPTVTTTHTEPFHVSKAIATLDVTSQGRAGWQARVSADPAQAGHFGRRAFPALTTESLLGPDGAALITEVFDEAADVVEVVRRLWDSWEDDAEIRDADTQRFIDRDKVHPIDFEGRFFSVRGPSITPRSPQGQPVVAALAHRVEPYEFAARSADLVFVTPLDSAGAASILAEVRAAEERVGRAGEPLRVYADVVVILDGPDESGADRLARLDALAGRPLVSDTTIFTGSASELADLVAAWNELGYDGVRLRPGALPDDLDLIVSGLAPELRRRGLTRTGYEAPTLRGLLGLPTHVPNRYASTPATALVDAR